MKNYPLTIELIPSTSFFDNVRSAVSKESWDIIRKDIYSKANYKCEICGGIGPKHPVECHEIWEFDDKKSIQILKGMIALCPDCHMVKHIGLAQINGKFNLAVSHLMNVNSCSQEEALKYIEYCFSLWNKRSKKKWKVDISFIKKNYNIEV